MQTFPSSSVDNWNPLRTFHASQKRKKKGCCCCCRSKRDMHGRSAGRYTIWEKERERVGVLLLLLLLLLLGVLDSIRLNPTPDWTWQCNAWWNGYVFPFSPQPPIFLLLPPPPSTSLLSHYKHRKKERERERRRSHLSQHIRLLLERLRASATFPFSQRKELQEGSWAKSAATTLRGRKREGKNLISLGWFAEWRGGRFVTRCPTTIHPFGSVRFVYFFHSKSIPIHRKK